MPVSSPLSLRYPRTVLRAGRAETLKPELTGAEGALRFTVGDGELPPTLRLDPASGALVTAGVRWDMTVRSDIPLVTDGVVHALAVEPSGGVLVAGSFSTVNGQPRANVARLGVDGVLDPVPVSLVTDGVVHALAVEPSGGVLVAGSFSTVNGQPRANVARLGVDGVLDPVPVPVLSDGAVHDLAFEPGGSLLVATQGRVERRGGYAGFPATIAVLVDDATGRRSAATVTLSVSTPAPPAPDLVDVAPGVVPGSLTVSWVPVEGPVTDYLVEYRPAGSTTWVPFVDGVTTVPKVTLTGLAPDTAYEIRVVAVNPGGRSTTVTTTTARTSVASPSAPTAAVAIPADAAIALSWTAPVSDGGAPITDYVIEQRAAPAGPWTVVDDGAAIATMAGLTGLTNGVAYDLRVRAVNAAGAGPWSAVVTATPRTVPDAPVAPVLVAAHQRLVASWDPPSGTGGSPITGYVVEHRVASSGPWTATVIGAPGTTTSTIGGLANGVAYEVRVAARNAAGIGPWSAAAVASPAMFTEAADLAGLAQTGDTWTSATGDFDNDGDDDLYVGVYGANALHRNNGDGTFTDVTAAAGVGDPGSARGVAWGDYDGDGDLDLSIANAGEANVLYRNNGNGTFTDVAAAAGVANTGASLGTSWADFDGDGDLDLYVGRWNQPNLLYRNNGDGTFTDVAVAAGVADGGRGEGVAWADFDGDGDLDLYLSNLGQPNRLYRNDGDGTFVDVAVTAGVAHAGNGTGASWGDYDGDGDPDLYLANWNQPNVLYRNEGNGSFTDVSLAAGVGLGGLSRGVSWADVDADGDLDLSVTNTWQANVLYRNNGDGTFTDIAAAAGVARSDDGRGAVWLDHDADGDLDLFLATAGGQANVLYRNNHDPAPDTIHRFRLSSDGRWNLGSVRVDLYAGTSRVASRTIDGGSGYISQNASPVHVLGLDPAIVYSVRVSCPGRPGVHTAVLGVPDNLLRTVDVPCVPAAPNAVVAVPGNGHLALTWAAPSSGGAIVDYLVEYRLTPSGTWTPFADGVSPATGATITGLVNGTALDVRVAAVNAAGASRWSAAVTATPAVFTSVGIASGVAHPGDAAHVDWGDYDGDGDLDLYVTNYGQANVLYRNNGNGTFTDVTAVSGTGSVGNAWDAAWGDYDGDGDLDLHIANYGQANVLHRNNGDGSFTDVTAIAGVGHTGNATDADWGDYDGDGDLDLHVANVGQANVLYRNNGDGSFTNVAATAGVAHTGNAYDGEWADTDGDGDLDLYLANSGANVLYRNNGDGTFTDVTAFAGVGHTGSANDADWGDIDGDGDLDLHVANWNQFNVLYRNNGDGTFTDITVTSGISRNLRATDADWGDFDSDGDLDLAISAYGQANALYRNNGGGTFTDVAGAASVADAGNSTDAAWGDVDGDGDVDLVVANEGQANALYRNGADPAAGTTQAVRVLRDGDPTRLGTTVDLLEGTTVVRTRRVGATPVVFGGLNPAVTYTLRYRCASGAVRTVVLGSASPGMRTVDASCLTGASGASGGRSTGVSAAGGAW